MVNNQNTASKNLTTILNKVAEEKIYGSVEIYFEGGRITQITQRIINKVSDKTPAKSAKNSKAYSPQYTQTNR